MAEDDRLKAIESKLDDHGQTLKGIEKALQDVAVQNQQITQLQKDVSSLWTKWDALSGPDGTVSQIRNFQASCPRKQIRFLWWVVVPQGLTSLAMCISLVVLAMKLIGG